jgi:hypothetical protein
MTKKPTKCGAKCKKKCKSEVEIEIKSPENIHSINNQEFRYPTIITRIKNFIVDLAT